MYTLYEIRCQTPGHIYVGITQHLENRLKSHIAGTGAKFTQKHGVDICTPLEKFVDEKSAKVAEWDRVQYWTRRGQVVAGAGRTQTR